MLSRKLAALTILALCVCFAVEVRAVVVTEESDAPPIAKPHEELECKICHKPHSMIPPAQNSAPCVKCHEKETGKDSHPTGVDYEGTAPPEGLPLSKDKKLTCGTCHILHETGSPNPPAALMRKKFNELCTTCHYTGQEPKKDIPPTPSET